MLKFVQVTGHFSKVPKNFGCHKSEIALKMRNFAHVTPLHYTIDVLELRSAIL